MKLLDILQEIQVKIPIYAEQVYELWKKTDDEELVATDFDNDWQRSPYNNMLKFLQNSPQSKLERYYKEMKLILKSRSR